MTNEERKLKNREYNRRYYQTTLKPKRQRVKPKGDLQPTLFGSQVEIKTQEEMTNLDLENQVLTLDDQISDFNLKVKYQESNLDIDSETLILTSESLKSQRSNLDSEVKNQDQKKKISLLTVHDSKQVESSVKIDSQENQSLTPKSQCQTLLNNQDQTLTLDSLISQGVESIQRLMVERVKEQIQNARSNRNGHGVKALPELLVVSVLLGLVCFVTASSFAEFLASAGEVRNQWPLFLIVEGMTLYLASIHPSTEGLFRAFNTLILASLVILSVVMTSHGTMARIENSAFKNELALQEIKLLEGEVISLSKIVNDLNARGAVTKASIYFERQTILQDKLAQKKLVLQKQASSDQMVQDKRLGITLRVLLSIISIILSSRLGHLWRNEVSLSFFRRHHA